MPWSETKKATIFKAMTAQYTSSDESDLSEDENGVMQLKGYRVRKLPWERSALTTVKKSLDEAYLKTLHPRLRANILERSPHPRPSTRGRPVDPLDWAVRPAAIGTPAPRLPTGSASGTSTSVSATLPCTSSPLPSVPLPDSLPTPNVTPEAESPLAVTLPSSTCRPATITPTTCSRRDADGALVSRAARPLQPVRSSLVNPPNNYHKNTDSSKRRKTTAKRKLCSWFQNDNLYLLNFWFS